MTRKRRSIPPVTGPRKTESIYPPGLTEKRQRFLDAYMIEGTVLGAARLAGVCDTSHYDWMQSPLYKAEFKKTVRRAKQQRMGIALKYAFGGFVKKKFTAKGDPIIDPETDEQYFEPVFDAGLMKTFIEADHPEKFAQKHEITGEITVTLSREAIRQRMDIEQERLAKRMAATAAAMGISGTGPISSSSPEAPTIDRTDLLKRLNGNGHSQEPVSND
jgi:hypothetical protein